ncbi:MAG: hypothetical protein L3I91_00690 [Mycoplasma sp.]
MWTTLKIINKYFWKSMFGPGVIFIFGPLYLFTITSTWSLLGIIKSPAVIPTTLAMVITFIGLFCIPLTVNNLRTSMVMKRLGTSRITQLTFLFSLFVYYFIASIICYLWMLISGFVIYSNRISDYTFIFSAIHWGDLLYSLTMNYLLAATIGIFILSFSKRNYVIGVTASVIVIFSFAFAGFATPINLIHVYFWKGVQTTLFDIVYIDPFWYTSSLSYESFFHITDDYYNLYASSIFDITVPLIGKTIATSDSLAHILTSVDKLANLVVPILLIMGFSIIDFKTFKWNVR